MIAVAFEAGAKTKLTTSDSFGFICLELNA